MVAPPESVPAMAAPPEPEGGVRYPVLVWRRLRRNTPAMGALVFIVAMFVVSWLAPVIANNRPLVMRYEGKLMFPAIAQLTPVRFVVHYRELDSVDFEALRYDRTAGAIMPLVPYSPLASSLDERLEPPSPRHLLGTDELGRDVLARMIHGAGISLKVGFVSIAIAMVLGVSVGALAGYYGGWMDVVLSRVIEVVICFPLLFLILAVIAFLPPSIYTIMVVIGLTRWTDIARYTRGEFIRLREREFTEAARALGVSDRRIILRHLLPNSLAPVLVTATFGVASAILIEAALSFLGLGVQPPTPSWGGILASFRQQNFAWWLTLFPGLAIFATVTSYNLLGEGLRDASDPRLIDPDRR